MGKKMVSIFCVTYNQVSYIKDALNGFIKQKTNFDYDVFVYDDASTDGTSEVLLEYQRKYPDIFKLYISERNRWKDKDRKSFMYKLKVDNLDGKYIAPCEGDDYWIDENKLQTQVDYMEAHPECSMYIHNSLWLDCSNNTFKEANTFDITNEADIDVRDLIIQKNSHPATASFMYRRELFNNPPFFFNAPVGDYTMLLCAAANGKVHYNSRIMSVYRFKSQGSYTSMLESKIEMKAYYFLGIIPFLIAYNNYTAKKYEGYIFEKVFYAIISLFDACRKNGINIKECYNLCISKGYKLLNVNDSLIEKINSIFLNEKDNYVSIYTKKFVTKYSNILIMGTGKYSQILTQQLINNNIKFVGYCESKTEPVKSFNGKMVWNLSEIPYKKDSFGILVGILITDKNDIIASLQNAQIDNYYMPFDYEKQIKELFK